MRYKPKIDDWIIPKSYSPRYAPKAMYQVTAIHSRMHQILARLFGEEDSVPLWIHEVRKATPAEVAAKVAERIRGSDRDQPQFYRDELGRRRLALD